MLRIANGGALAVREAEISKGETKRAPAKRRGILVAVLETARDLRRLGLISEERLRRFERRARKRRE